MDSLEMTALSGVHRCETSGAVNLGQPWHSKPSSSSDRRHNSLLPAATHFNDLWGTLSEATNAEKSILFQGRFDRQNVFFLVSQKTPLVVENLLCKMEWKYINYFVVFFFFFAFFICLQHLLCFCRPPLLHCGARLCQGNDLRREWWKAAIIERSWATKIWSNIYIRAVFERPQWHFRLTIKFWAAGPMWRHKTIHSGGDGTFITVSNCNTHLFSTLSLQETSLIQFLDNHTTVYKASHWI